MGNLTFEELTILESIKKSLKNLNRAQLEEVVQFTKDLKDKKNTSGVDKKAFFD